MTTKARVKGKSQVITIVLQLGLSIQLVNANKKLTYSSNRRKSSSKTALAIT